MTNDFETLRQLFASYLHQDFVEEFGSDTEAIQAMVNLELRERTQKASIELQNLLHLNMSDTELGNFTTDKLGCFFDPSSNGQTYHEWLASVLKHMTSSVR